MSGATSSSRAGGIRFFGLSEMTKRKRAKKARYSKSRKLAVLISPDDPDAVLTFVEWCLLNHISQRQGRRILKAPGGPIVTQLSDNRIGISRRNNRTWQAARARA
jgi:hypothetical protein